MISHFFIPILTFYLFNNDILLPYVESTEWILKFLFYAILCLAVHTSVVGTAFVQLFYIIEFFTSRDNFNSHIILKKHGLAAVALELSGGGLDLTKRKTRESNCRTYFFSKERLKI